MKARGGGPLFDSRDRRGAVLLCLVAAVLGSCAGIPGRGADRAVSSASETAASRNPAPKDRAPQPEGRLSPAPSRAPSSAAVLAGAPAEAVEYLEALSAAVYRRDVAYVLDQGETQYAKRVRGAVDEDAYLALLLRVGPYANEGEAKSDSPPRIRPQDIRSLRYTGWEEDGPLVRARGRLASVSGKEWPCRIDLLWKALPPRILGRHP